MPRFLLSSFPLEPTSYCVFFRERLRGNDLLRLSLIVFESLGILNYFKSISSCAKWFRLSVALASIFFEFYICSKVTIDSDIQHWFSNLSVKSRVFSKVGTTNYKSEESRYWMGCIEIKLLGFFSSKAHEGSGFGFSLAVRKICVSPKTLDISETKFIVNIGILCLKVVGGEEIRLLT